jgi:hypothetical protein
MICLIYLFTLFGRRGIDSLMKFLLTLTYKKYHVGLYGKLGRGSPL